MTTTAHDDRPVIGICAALERAAWSFWDQPAHLVAASYVAQVQRADALAVLLAVDADRPERLLERIDGLLLIGGADVDPSMYGAEHEPATERTASTRDRFELALVQAALAHGMPVLGICRGMQIINVARGGTLRQDLRDADGSTPHRRRLGSFDGTEHFVRLAPGSLAVRVIGEPIHRVHCHHHQAIDALGEGLVVTGWDRRDKVPEAIEDADGRWLLGVQWHPEARRDGRVMCAFAKACGDHAAHRKDADHDAVVTA